MMWQKKCIQGTSFRETDKTGKGRFLAGCAAVYSIFDWEKRKFYILVNIRNVWEKRLLNGIKDGILDIRDRRSMER